MWSLDEYINFPNSIPHLTAGTPWILKLKLLYTRAIRIYSVHIAYMPNYNGEVGRESCSLKRWVFNLRLKIVEDCAVLTSTGRSVHHHGARTDSSRDREVHVCGGGGGGGRRQVSGGSVMERSGRCIRSDLLLDVSWGWSLKWLVCTNVLNWMQVIKGSQ